MSPDPRRAIVALALSVLVGAAGASAQAPNGTEGPLEDLPLFDGESDQEDTDVVEGHTVYKTIVNENGTEQAAVVVKVQNKTRGQVLWFDDSFLHKTQRAAACGGSVWATDDDGFLLSDKSHYEVDKTYRIDGPSTAWMVTRYKTDPATPRTTAWAVEVQCDGGQFYQTGDLTVNPDSCADPCPPPGDVGVLEYNALLWFEISDLSDADDGQRDFGRNGADNDDNTTEGNSHPYNPVATSPSGTHTHDVAKIDLYYELNNTLEHEDNPSFDNTEDFGSFHGH